MNELKERLIKIAQPISGTMNGKTYYSFEINKLIKFIESNFVSKNELDTLMEGNSTWESGWNHGYDELGETLLAEFREKGTITIDELERFLDGN